MNSQELVLHSSVNEIEVQHSELRLHTPQPSLNRLEEAPGCLEVRSP